MKNAKTTLLLVAGLVVLLLGATALYRSLAGREAAAPDGTQSAAQPESEPEAESSAAPDFTVLDADGNSSTLSDHLGTPVVLNFWASWCGPCKSELPVFDAAAAELAGTVDFMMVNLTDGGRETVEGVSQFLEEQGYRFPVYFDTLSEGAAAYAVRSIPVTYFIDAEGNVQAYSAGSLNEDALRQGLDRIVGE